MPRDFDPSDTPPGGLTPEETLRRLEEIYGAAPEAAPQMRVPAPGPSEPGAAPPTAKAPSVRPGPSKRRWYVPKLRWLYLYLPILLVFCLIAAAVWGWREFNGIYRVDTENALSAASDTGTNYLIVGSDSRDGVDPDDPNIEAIGTDVVGRRADTIILLRVEGSTASMMSIPRDLWVENAATGQNGRINGTYAAGPANLIETVSKQLGTPVNQYIEVDFVSFAGMVDAVGGIDIEFPHAAFDKGSGLVVLSPGVHTLDGAQALAYVRARNYTEIIDGREVVDPTGDIGRQARQQLFITEVLSEVGATKNPVALAKIAASAAEGMRIDDELGFFDALGFARGLGASDMATVVLPTIPANVGGASVLFLDEPAAAEPLALFGGGTR